MNYRNRQTGEIVEATHCTLERKDPIDGVTYWVAGDPNRPRDFSVGHITDLHGKRWHVRPEDWVVKSTTGYSKWSRELFHATFEAVQPEQGVQCPHCQKWHT